MSIPLEEILGPEALAGFLEPGAIKCGLPREAYTSQAFFALEQRTVFTSGWSFAGFAHELAAPGSLQPITVGGLPLVLVRGKDGAIRVFHNVCRHRGLKLVDQPCAGRRTLSCPYHGWTYELDGRLKGAPNFGGAGKSDAPGFDPEAHGLVPVASAVWHDWIFVNPDGSAPPFADYVGPLEAAIGDFDLSDITPIIHIDSGEVAANWKFLCENFIEPYHVPLTHPQTAAGQPLEEHYMIEDGLLVGCGIDVGDRTARKANGGGRGREVCLDFSAWYHLLFPNFLFFVYFGEETHVNVMLNTPLAPDRTHQRRVIYQQGGQPPSEDQLAAWRQLNCDVVAEDWHMAERLQAGRASPVTATGGVLSPVWETSAHAFDHLVLAAMRR